MNSRIYNEKVNIDYNNINNFYSKRAKQVNKYQNKYTAVILGDQDPTYSVKRDNWERQCILPLLDINKNKNVLDIGCGMGRLCQPIHDKCNHYYGVDLSSDMINLAKTNFSNNCTFIVSSFQDIFNNSIIKENKYDVVIITGVSMYINDDDLKYCYSNLLNLLNDNAIIYIEESIGVNNRLTLNHIWSDNLDDHYDAIYRTDNEYKELLKDIIDNSEILKEEILTNLDKKGMSDTSHWCIISKLK